MIFPVLESYTIPVSGNLVTSGLLMSDILFLSTKEFLGKLRHDDGSLSATGDLATLTANTAKDMYLARAKVIFFLNNSNTQSVADAVVLKVNGTIVETAKSTLTMESTFDAGMQVFSYEFSNIGHKVDAGQVIKLEVITLDADTNVEGFIECFEEDNGVSPLDDFS